MSEEITEAQIAELAEIIASNYGSTVEEMLSPSKALYHKIGRDLLAYVLRREFGFSVERVGGAINRSHSNAIRAIERMDQWLGSGGKRGDSPLLKEIRAWKQENNIG